MNEYPSLGALARGGIGVAQSMQASPPLQVPPQLQVEATTDQLLIAVGGLHDEIEALALRLRPLIVGGPTGVAADNRPTPEPARSEMNGRLVNVLRGISEAHARLRTLLSSLD